MHESSTTSPGDGNDGRIDHCPSCGLPLPLRIPRPGEVAASWACTYCRERFFAVLDDDCPPDIHDNVQPAGDVNPRVIVAGETLATMHKRYGTLGRVLSQRHHHRQAAFHKVTLTVADRRLEVLTFDLSASGFGFLSGEDIAEGTEMTAQFHQPPRTPPCRCVVRHCTPGRDGQYRIGVVFKP